ncbi:MAG: galactokinase, partial [Ktedonobacterales bacterium]
CQWAEQDGAGAQVGIMDQAAACLGRPHHAILLDCRSLGVEYLPARLPGAAWVVFDTAAPHSVAASEYNARRSQCEAAVARLAPALERETVGRSVRALRDVAEADLAQHAALLDATTLRRVRHVVSEIARTLHAAEALRAGDAEALGALLNASHLSLRDQYEVSGPELDAAVEIAQGVAGVYGARMMGAGFGGSIIALVRREVALNLRARLAEEYPRRTGLRGATLACAITGQMGARATENRA